MGEVITAFTSWPSLLLVIFIFGFAPGFALRLLLKIYPLDDPRRRELLSELYAVPRLERPFWVAEQLETALLEGIPLRARYVKHKRGQQQIERAIEILRRQMTPWSSPSSPFSSMHALRTQSPPSPGLPSSAHLPPGKQRWQGYWSAKCSLPQRGSNGFLYGWTCGAGIPAPLPVEPSWSTN